MNSGQQKGFRQNYPMSSTLFNVYLADIEESFKRKGVGEIVIDIIKVWSIMYADNIVLVLESKKVIKEMLSTF